MPHELTGPGSLDRRPDAISSDYSFAYTFGPVQLSDFSQGLLNRAWRIRADNNLGSVLLSRANDANTDWEPETVLFNYAGAPVVEVDAAFDQQGRVFVCCERSSGVAGASELWFYYFNGLVGDYTLENFGPGRTPRAILDSPLDPAIADVLVFYADDANDRISYRQQRDRYQVVYPTPVLGSANKFVEDAVRSESYRIYVYYSVRNIDLGQYTLEHIESLMYPVINQAEDFLTFAATVREIGGVLEKALIIFTDDLATYPIADGPVLGKDDRLAFGASFGAGGDLHDTLITHTLFDTEQLTFGAAFGPGGTLVVVGPTIINHTLFDTEQLSFGAGFGAGGVLFVALISNTIFDPDNLTFSAGFGAGGTLV
jgi:hypothetical protein